jgi:hypothetical protein
MQGQVTSDSMKCVKNSGNIWCGMIVGGNRITPCSICNHPIGRVKRIKIHERLTVYSVLGDCCKADRWRVRTSMFVIRYSLGTLS